MEMLPRHTTGVASMQPGIATFQRSPGSAGSSGGEPRSDVCHAALHVAGSKSMKAGTGLLNG